MLHLACGFIFLSVLGLWKNLYRIGCEAVFMPVEPHIGHVIQSTLKAQGRSVIWFARQLSCDRTNVYKIFSRDTIDTKLLMRICNILGVDFFAFLSEVYKNSYVRPTTVV